MTSPIAFESTVTTLTILVAVHNQSFQRLYPQSSYIPKLHYMVHLPDQLRKFGPLRHQWCMRMEAKNGFFKKKKFKNTKNLPMSVAYEHQFWMAAQRTEDDGTACKSYLMKNIQTKKGNLIYWADLADKMLPPSFNPDGKACLNVKNLPLMELTYAKNSILLHTFGTVTNFPMFVRISFILKCDSDVLCVGEACHVEYFNSHLNSYCLSVKCDEVLSFNPSKAFIPWPVFIADDGDNNNIIVSPYSIPDIELFDKGAVMYLKYLRSLLT